jgi:hypothetical protein
LYPKRLHVSGTIVVGVSSLHRLHRDRDSRHIGSDIYCNAGAVGAVVVAVASCLLRTFAVMFSIDLSSK